jgi:hypothetical protein
MRAIIIEEERFDEICELMRSRVLESKSKPPLDITPAVWEKALEEAHRTINYEFVKWAQSHGARCVR